MSCKKNVEKKDMCKLNAVNAIRQMLGLLQIYQLTITFRNQKKKTNDHGTENNVVNVKSSDFEVFEALDVDSVSTGHHEGKPRHGGSPHPPWRRAGAPW